MLAPLTFSDDDQLGQVGHNLGFAFHQLRERLRAMADVGLEIARVSLEKARLEGVQRSGFGARSPGGRSCGLPDQLGRCGVPRCFVIGCLALE